MDKEKRVTIHLDCVLSLLFSHQLLIFAYIKLIRISKS